MNRSILIVICDFLLLSLLTFSTDINHMANDKTQRSAHVDVTTNEVVQPGKDMMTLMNQALADERKGREQLQQQLASARNTAGSQQEALARAEQANERLQQQSASLQQQAAGLQQQYTAAQANVEDLNRQLQNNSTQAQMSRQKLAETQAEEQKQSDLAAQLKQQLDLLMHSNQLTQTALQLSEAERQAALDRAALMQQDVQAARAENARLAEGFKSLATNSSQLTQEIRENRALAPNTIFSEFVTNRVQTAIDAARTGFLGIDEGKNRQTQTILVTDGTNTYAIGHVDDTPLTLWDPGTDWDGLTGELTAHSADVPIRSVSFDQDDPRVVMFPITQAEAQQLGCKVYRISTDPYKFQDAVLIGADNGYYGQCDFQIDLSTPQYVKLDRSLLRGLFGKFNPSRGDVVFSRTGQLLGIMVNSTYCLMIHDFAASATLPFSANVRDEHTGGTLARLYDNIFQLPLRLQ
jgi:hypothetical protein